MPACPLASLDHARPRGQVDASHSLPVPTWWLALTSRLRLPRKEPPSLPQRAPSPGSRAAGRLRELVQPADKTRQPAVCSGTREAGRCTGPGPGKETRAP